METKRCHTKILCDHFTTYQWCHKDQPGRLLQHAAACGAMPSWGRSCGSPTRCFRGHAASGERDDLRRLYGHRPPRPHVLSNLIHEPWTRPWKSRTSTMNEKASLRESEPCVDDGLSSIIPRFSKYIYIKYTRFSNYDSDWSDPSCGTLINDTEQWSIAIFVNNSNSPIIFSLFTNSQRILDFFLSFSFGAMVFVKWHDHCSHYRSKGGLCGLTEPCWMADDVTLFGSNPWWKTLDWN